MKTADEKLIIGSLMVVSNFHRLPPGLMPDYSFIMIQYIFFSKYPQKLYFRYILGAQNMFTLGQGIFSFENDQFINLFWPVLGKSGLWTFCALLSYQKGKGALNFCKSRRFLCFLGV